MSLDFVHRSKRGAVEILLSKEWGDATAHELTREDNLWVVHCVNGRAFINVLALYYRVNPGRGWWVRPEGEGDACGFHDCPLHLLELAPVYSDYWRWRVFRHHGVRCRNLDMQSVRRVRSVFLRNSRNSGILTHPW